MPTSRPEAPAAPPPNPGSASLDSAEAFSLEATYRLSPYALLRTGAEGGMVLETPFDGRALRVTAPNVLTLLLRLADGVRPADLLAGASAEAEASLCTALATLEAHGALVRDEDADDTALAYWSLPDLLFHARSRRGRHTAPIGGTYSHDGPRPEPPRPGTRRIALDAPDASFPGDPTLAEVLRMRRSIHSTRPVEQAELGALLHAACRLRHVRPSDPPVRFKAYPSGGGLHACTMYVSVHACRGLAPGLYRYADDEHALYDLEVPEAGVGQLLDDAATAAGMEDRPPVLLTIAGHLPTVAWKYESIAYRLLLKEVGALYQTLYLTATALRLAPCALGSGPSDTFTTLTGTDYYSETSIGEFVIGGGG